VTRGIETFATKPESARGGWSARSVRHWPQASAGHARFRAVAPEIAATWAIAVTLWRIGRVEDKYSTPLA
jgi:hypothetical protein